MTNETLVQARILQSLIAFHEAERQRVSAILGLVGIARDAKLTFVLPDPGQDPDPNKLLESLAMGLTASYAVGKKAYSLPSLKFAGTTYGGVPVLCHPSTVQSVAHIQGLFQGPLDDLINVLTTYKGMHPADAFARLGATHLVEELRNVGTTEPAPDDISA